jgi:hypothetical protein
MRESRSVMAITRGNILITFLQLIIEASSAQVPLYTCDHLKQTKKFDKPQPWSENRSFSSP